MRLPLLGAKVKCRLEQARVFRHPQYIMGATVKQLSQPHAPYAVSRLGSRAVLGPCVLPVLNTSTILRKEFPTAAYCHYYLHPAGVAVSLTKKWLRIGVPGTVYRYSTEFTSKLPAGTDIRKWFHTLLSRHFPLGTRGAEAGLIVCCCGPAALRDAALPSCLSISGL